MARASVRMGDPVERGWAFDDDMMMGDDGRSDQSLDHQKGKVRVTRGAAKSSMC